MNRAIPMAVLVLVLGGGAGPVRASTLVRISDLDYIHRTYYFIADHPLYLDHASLRVFRDDRNPTNDVYTNPRPGRARLDPRAPQGPANPETPGYFDILTAGVDYNVIDLYIPQAGAEIPILEMTAAQDINSVLGVSYVEQVGSESIAVGNSDFFATDPALGKNAGEYLLKAIKADYGIPSTLNDGTYDPSDPWYPILNYELRNLYRLGIENIDRSRTVITVRQRDAAFSVDPDSFHGSSFLSLLGLDQIGATLGSPPDGKVDDQFIDSGRGILFFPDLHPFDPDTARAGCPADHGGFLCLDNLARNPLRDCYASDCIANPFVYKVHHPDPLTQSRFYIEVMIPPLPTEELLHPNHPNPFNPFRSSTTIDFETPTAGRVHISIFDIRGTIVHQFDYPSLPAGPHLVTWYGDDSRGYAVRSGVYVCRLEAEGLVRTRRLVVVK